MRRGKQNHICVSCARLSWRAFPFVFWRRGVSPQFVENPKNGWGYSDEVRKSCLKMYVNGMGFRDIDVHFKVLSLKFVTVALVLIIFCNKLATTLNTNIILFPSFLTVFF